MTDHKYNTDVYSEFNVTVIRRMPFLMMNNLHLLDDTVNETWFNSKAIWDVNNYKYSRYIGTYNAHHEYLVDSDAAKDLWS